MAVAIYYKVTLIHPLTSATRDWRTWVATFDVLAAVLFDEGYGVTRAILIPHAVAAALARRVEHTNSWRLMLEDRVWGMEGTRDVTEALARAASEG